MNHSRILRALHVVASVLALAGCAGSVAATDANDSDAVSGDSNPTDVVTPTSCATAGCEAGMVCVRDQVLGGALITPDDAGTCPAGTTLMNNQCQRNPTFRCVFRPSGCDPLACSCAQSICSSGSQCATPSNDELDCTLLAP